MITYSSIVPRRRAFELIARRAGMPTEAFARRFLFEPIGITDLRWRTDPQGISIGGYDAERCTGFAFGNERWMSSA